MKIPSQLNPNCNKLNTVTQKMKVNKAPIKNKTSLKRSRKRKKIKAKNLKIEKKTMKMQMLKTMRTIPCRNLTTIKKSKKDKLLCFLNRDSMTSIIPNTIFADSFQDITG